MNSTLKTVLVLSVIALFAGLALGVVYFFTKSESSLPDAAALNALAPADGYVQLTAEGATQLEFGTLKSVCVPVDGNGKAVSDSFIFLADGNGGFSGTISMLVLITDGKIANVVCYENGETPGLGTNALTDTYLSRYIGIDITNDVVLKGLAKDYWSKPEKESGHENDAIQIDGYTGATRSSTAVVNSISTIHSYYVSNAESLLLQLNKLK